MSRTNKKHMRIYIDGYDMSGYTRDAGTLGWAFDAQQDACLTDAVKNVLLGQPTISAGPINATFDNTATSGMHVLHATPGGQDYVCVAIGTNAAPAAGDPFFAWYMYQKSYTMNQGSGFLSANLDYEPSTGFVTYGKPWGNIILPLTAKTAANAANNGVDGVAGTSAGGIFYYHATGGDDTSITLTLEDSDDNGSTDAWAAVTGATSGAINPTTAPVAGMVNLATTTAIKRYVRWQLDITGGSTAVSLFYGLIRG
jgi:hypothetical protein